jgi:hypothetical protein
MIAYSFRIDEDERCFFGLRGSAGAFSASQWGQNIDLAALQQPIISNATP